MSRHYFWIAALLLLVAVAAVRFTGGKQASNWEKEQAVVANGEDHESQGQAQRVGHELVDPLVPPINFAFDPDADEELPPEAVSPFPLLGPKGWTSVRLHGAINYGEFLHGERAFFDGHTGNVCASGCAWNAAPTEKLAETHYRHLLEQFAREPMDETSFALESLLYFGRQTRRMIARHGTAPLDPQRDAVLRRELRKTHAYIENKLVDEYGVVRASLPRTLVPLDRRHLFDMDINNVQPLETSGTVKRVGLYHLWTRL